MLEVSNPPAQVAAAIPPSSTSAPATAPTVPVTLPMAALTLPAVPAATIPAVALVMAAPPAQAPLLDQGDHCPPPLTVKFEGTPKQLAYFLTQVWHYMECYRTTYPDNAIHIDCVALALDGDMA